MHMYIPLTLAWSQWWSGSTPLSILQRTWDCPILDRISASVFEGSTCPAARARWYEKRVRTELPLNALPCAPLGTFLHNNTVRIAASLHLSTKICHLHRWQCRGWNRDPRPKLPEECRQIDKAFRNQRHHPPCLSGSRSRSRSGFSRALWNLEHTVMTVSGRMAWPWCCGQRKSAFCGTLAALIPYG
jgi:hypothetical protein